MSLDFLQDECKYIGRTPLAYLAEFAKIRAATARVH